MWSRCVFNPLPGVPGIWSAASWAEGNQTHCCVLYDVLFPVSSPVSSTDRHTSILTQLIPFALSIAHHYFFHSLLYSIWYPPASDGGQLVTSFGSVPCCKSTGDGGKDMESSLSEWKGDKDKSTALSAIRTVTVACSGCGSCLNNHFLLS